MSNKNEVIAAIDIGTTKIVAIIGTIDGENKTDSDPMVPDSYRSYRFRILGIACVQSKGVKRGNVLNLEETVKSIKEAMGRAEEMSGIKVHDVFVGIAGQNIKCLKNTGYLNRESYEQEISKHELNLLISDQFRVGLEPGEEIIHVLPQIFIIDGQDGCNNPIGNFGKRLEGIFHIIIAKVVNINNLKKCVERAGFKTNKLILEPLASSHAVLTDDEKEVGVALVDIGGGTSDLAIYYENTICYTAVLPFGGNVITSDIKTAFNILERDAESVKVEQGSALEEVTSELEIISIKGVSGRGPKEISKKEVSKIIQARMEEIIRYVQFHIENSGFADKLGAGIVLTGGGAMLKNLPQLVAFHTGYEIRIGYPVQNIASYPDYDINHPKYSTSVGLMMMGYEEKKLNPETYISKEPATEEKSQPEESNEPEREKDKTSKGFGAGRKIKSILGGLFDNTDTNLSN